MKKLVVIDLQQDFINENTNKSIEDIEKLINEKEYDDVIFTRFIGNKDSLIHKSLKDNSGLTEEGIKLVVNPENYKVLDKNIYSAFPVLKSHLTHEDEIYLTGIDVDCCVLMSALNLFENNYNVFVLKNYVYCTSGEEIKKEALDIIERCIGKDRVI